MKFEDLLMQRREEHQRKLTLQEEVVKLQADLDKQQNLNRALQCAIHRPAISRPHISSLLPLQVQALLAELVMVEEEIICLERKVEELNLCMYQEKKQTEEWELLQLQWRKQKYHRYKEVRRRELRDLGQPEGQSCNTSNFRSHGRIRGRKASLGSASEIQTLPSTSDNGCGYLHEKADEVAEGLGQSRNQKLGSHEIRTEEPNRLSEELIKCLIGIFLRLNQPLDEHDSQRPADVRRLTLSCMNTKGLVSKTSFNCKTPMFSTEDKKPTFDPYGVLPDLDGVIRDIGPYKNCIQFTRSSLDMSHVSECFPAIGKLRVLMHKLSTVELSFLTYKQKLAFWINIYNACIMHAFLRHGLPSTADKLLALMNKAALNVGGIVLNALAIEHFILRHPCDSHNGIMNGKEMLLRHTYGLGYPEPNVTFALCRGSWSSPALRIYTAEDVINELDRAKTEYLEASIGVTSRKKIVVPKLLHCHMQDFAGDMESLLEWIYSQLPQLGPLKKLIMACLNGETKSPIAKMVRIQPYKSEFRYLLIL